MQSNYESHAQLNHWLLFPKLVHGPRIELFREIGKMHRQQPILNQTIDLSQSNKLARLIKSNIYRSWDEAQEDQ